MIPQKGRKSVISRVLYYRSVGHKIGYNTKKT
nr:MAG TPA: hypothetical protein [Bacteriophage sp.]